MKKLTQNQFTLTIAFQCKTPSVTIGEISETGEMYLTNKNKITFAQFLPENIKDDNAFWS